MALSFVALTELGHEPSDAGYPALARYYGGPTDRHDHVVSGTARAVADRLLEIAAAGFDSAIALPATAL